MFGILRNLTKAAVAVALTPVALVVDILTLFASADHEDDHPFGRTGDLLNAAGKSVNKAIDSDIT
jgi:hypothetical protein